MALVFCRRFASSSRGRRRTFLYRGASTPLAGLQPGKKLLRHGPAGQEKPGALDADGQVCDLSLLIPDFTPEWMSPAKLQALAAIDLSRMPLVPKGARLGTPVTGIRQFVAIGLNYRKHAEESYLEISKEPVLFTKALTSIGA